MKCRHKPSTTTKKAPDSATRPNRFHTHTHKPKRLAHPRSPMPPLSTLTAQATHARPLPPKALASVPYGLVLVRVRVWGKRTAKRNRQPGVIQKLLKWYVASADYSVSRRAPGTAQTYFFTFRPCRPGPGPCLQDTGTAQTFLLHVCGIKMR